MPERMEGEIATPVRSRELQPGFGTGQQIFNQPCIVSEGMSEDGEPPVAARLKLESVSSKAARPMTRRAVRFAATSRVSVQSSHGDRSKAFLRDVSTFGCSLESDAIWMRSGMFVSIGLSRDWAVQAVVRWVRAGSAGVEFLRPISEADARTLSSD